MNKRRVTLNLGVDVVEALQAVGGSSMSAIANDALREALESRAHQAALLRWLDELDAKHGAPTEAELAEADAFLDALERGDVGGSGAARGRALCWTREHSTFSTPLLVRACAP